MEQQAEIIISEEVESLLTEEALKTIRLEAHQIPAAIAALGIIKTPEDFERAASAGVAAAKITRQLEDMRKAAVQPWNDKVKRINEQFKYFITFFEGFKDKIAASVSVYNQEQKAIADKAQKALDDKHAKQVAKAEEKGLPAPQAPAPRIEQPAKTAHVSGGRVTNVLRPKYEILSEKDVPREYLMVDEKKLGAAVRARIINKDNAPAWLKVWEEESPSFV